MNRRKFKTGKARLSEPAVLLQSKPARAERRALPALCFALILLATFAAHAAPPSDWQHTQNFDVAAPGLVKLSLPPDTLDAARPGLEDLRLYDDAGNEVPYLIEHPAPAAEFVRSAKSFQVALNSGATVATIETGLTQPLDRVTLESPANQFIKSVRVERSSDGKTWQLVADGKPIFRQPDGAAQLQIEFPAAACAWLRLTIDDRRSSPVPFTSATLHAAPGERAPGESLSIAIKERRESPGETRLVLDLGAANLDLTTLHIDTAEALFTREIALAVSQVSGDSIREQVLAQGIIYRVALEGLPVSTNLSVTMRTQVRSRELLMIVRNHDSPPLPIDRVRAERRPVFLVLLARAPGKFQLLTGNSRCGAPHYDLAALSANLKSAALSDVKISALTANSDYHPPEVLPNLPETGAALDVSAWRYRKPVHFNRGGAQQVELDADVLTHAQAGLDDLRLIRGESQVAYILERTSLSRELAPDVTTAKDPKRPGLSRWVLKLSHPGLPVTRLSCVARTPLFSRNITVYEEVSDQRGGTYQRVVGDATWTKTPERRSDGFTLTLNGPLQSDTLFVETDNGDNPPVVLEKFQLFHPVTRVLFKARPDDHLFLYYGQPSAVRPNYDLNLVAAELLSADKAAASIGAEETLKKSPWRESQAGHAGVIFWGILAVVVVVLLVIISRLLPKAEPQNKNS